MQETVLKKVSCNISHICTCLQICSTQYATHFFTKGLNTVFVFFFFYFNNVDKSSITCQISPILFLYQSVSDVTKVNWIQFQHTVIENKSCRHCVARNCSVQPSLSNTWFNFLLRLMHDVSIDPLSQNRIKPLGSDPSDQHVLSIWTHPAPLQFHFYSSAAMLQN